MALLATQEDSRIYVVHNPDGDKRDNRPQCSFALHKLAALSMTENKNICHFFCVYILHYITFTFSRRFYPKRLTRMYTQFTFTLMAHCTSGAIRGSVSCLRMLRQGIELATF